jgi:hypothetical protein
MKGRRKIEKMKSKSEKEKRRNESFGKKKETRTPRHEPKV